MKSIYILHKGSTVLGAYESANLLSEAQAIWQNDFLRRFGRCASEAELPKVAFVRMNKMLDFDRVVVGEDQRGMGECN